MKTEKKFYRPLYYEDDVVEYTLRGKVKIPKKYEYCTINGRKYKSFRNQTTAKIVLAYKIFNGRTNYRINPENYGYDIFKCKKCGLYHIMSEKVKSKL